MVRLPQGTYSWTCLAADSAAGETQKITLSGTQLREKRFPCAGNTVGAQILKMCVLQNMAKCVKMDIFQQVTQKKDRMNKNLFYPFVYLASYLDHAKWIKKRQRIDRSLAGAPLA